MNPPIQELTREELWGQLTRSVSLRETEDQIAWVIMGLFSAGNSILLVGLFNGGHYPEKSIGLIISITGFLTAFAWNRILRRALIHLDSHEKVMRRIEEKLGVSPDYATSSLGATHSKSWVGLEIPARIIMRTLSMVAALGWLAAILKFAIS